MKNRFQESGPLSQRIAPLDLLAWLQSGDRKNFTSVSWGSSFLLKWFFAYTLHQAWQSTIDEAKVLVLFVAGNDIAWWCIQVDLHMSKNKMILNSPFLQLINFVALWNVVDSQIRSECKTGSTWFQLNFPIRLPTKWTQVDSSGLDADLSPP